ncbi:hypothetical protein IFM89_019822 [Coptis chinensis]|uniref:Chalcone--flavonone isomerase n=1 Tax=Coptis chinensis TaxID=261450 RepID=A0A835M5K4_9MAGN|nr:hypothetical protein IFM89_019822 [Coptis chinensis]
MKASCFSLVTLYGSYLRRVFTSSGLSPQALDIDSQTTISFWAPTPNSHSIKKPSLVLIHGFGPRSIWQWRRQVRTLSPHFNVYVPDLIFFGESTTTSSERSEVFQAVSMGKLFEKLGVKKYSVMGTSYGGFVAYNMAKMFGERVEKVIIASSGLNRRLKDGVELLERAKVEKIEDLMLPKTASQMRNLMRLAVKNCPPIMPDFVLNDFINTLYSDNLVEKKELLMGLTFGNDDKAHVSPLQQSRHFYVPGSLALQQAYNRVSKFAGALLSGKLQGSRHGGTFCVQNFLGLYCGSWSRVESAIPLFVGKIASSTVTHIWKELEQIQSFPVLSLAAALVPPFDSLSAKVLAMPLENSDVLVNSHMDQTHCIRRHQGSSELSLHEINWTRDAVEPVTGIEFPTVLDNISAGKKNSTLRSEVLVGTGSKIMRIIKVKSLKLYAFGLYVQPDSICKKLGRKYASVPVGELSNQPEFFEDLLREDLDMTVRLVVNYKGLKISTVRDAFESSLRARLQKMNPEPDYHCLRTFGSCFSQDISLPPGTTINFQQTADGQLITEIGGKQIGAVHSKDLCRAFFGMYIGDAPVSVQAKEEIARKVGSIIRRC